MSAHVAHSLGEKARTGDVVINEDVNFDGLLLSEAVLKGLRSTGFERPSPIQLKAIPLGRCGLDLIVQAKSGTGKTCVFTVIALESVQTDSSALQVLVLAPTREIAIQIWDVINSVGSAMLSLTCQTFIGGMPLQEDKQKLKKCHIAVGTPGRIKQLIESSLLKTDSIRMFILDEADKLLEESFQEQINWIYSTLPDNKQMLALSATYPEYLAQHLTAYMRNPTFLRLNISDPALLGIKQYKKIVAFHPLPNKLFEYKMKAVVDILSSVNFQQCLMFSNLQTRAQNMSDGLNSKGWPTTYIAGSHDQKDRNEAMAKLKTYKCRILISTDLTARGIDADKVNMVINLDVPKYHETYLHRIGRAGRFGSFGAAITIVSVGQEEMDLYRVEQKCNTCIKELPDPIPSTLTKSECILRLDDVVSTEKINTEGIRLTSPKKDDMGKTGNKKSQSSDGKSQGSDGRIQSTDGKNSHRDRKNQSLGTNGNNQSSDEESCISLHGEPRNSSKEKQVNQVRTREKTGDGFHNISSAHNVKGEETKEQREFDFHSSAKEKICEDPIHKGREKVDKEVLLEVSDRKTLLEEPREQKQSKNGREKDTEVNLLISQDLSDDLVRNVSNVSIKDASDATVKDIAIKGRSHKVQEDMTEASVTEVKTIAQRIDNSVLKVGKTEEAGHTGKVVKDSDDSDISWRRTNVSTENVFPCDQSHTERLDNDEVRTLEVSEKGDCQEVIKKVNRKSKLASVQEMSTRKIAKAKRKFIKPSNPEGACTIRTGKDSKPLVVESKAFGNLPDVNVQDLKEQKAFEEEVQKYELQGAENVGAVRDDQHLTLQKESSTDIQTAESPSIGKDDAKTKCNAIALRTRENQNKIPTLSKMIGYQEIKEFVNIQEISQQHLIAQPSGVAVHKRLQTPEIVPSAKKINVEEIRKSLLHIRNFLNPKADGKEVGTDCEHKETQTNKTQNAVKLCDKSCSTEDGGLDSPIWQGDRRKKEQPENYGEVKRIEAMGKVSAKQQGKDIQPEIRANVKDCSELSSPTDDNSEVSTDGDAGDGTYIGINGPYTNIQKSKLISGNWNQRMEKQYLEATSHSYKTDDSFARSKKDPKPVNRGNSGSHGTNSKYSSKNQSFPHQVSVFQCDHPDTYDKQVNPYEEFPHVYAKTPYSYASAPNPYAMDPYPSAMGLYPHVMTPYPHATTPYPHAMTPNPHAMTPYPYAMTPYPHGPMQMAHYPQCTSHSLAKQNGLRSVRKAMQMQQEYMKLMFNY